LKLNATVRQLVDEYNPGEKLHFSNEKEKENENDKENENENENEVSFALSERIVPTPHSTPFPQESVKNYVGNYVENSDDVENDVEKPFKGAVMLSENQIASLLDGMGIQDFDYYGDRLDTFIQEKNARISGHADMIRKWYREDQR
jgi:hypothetical protein